MRQAGAWNELQAMYLGNDRPGTRQRRSPQLARVAEIARGHDVTHLLIERRYIDRDWRAENSRYYASTFRRRPSVCHRVHFFTAPVPADHDLSGLQPHYRGYAVIRPLSIAPVGRTMIAPPAELAAGFRVESTEIVDVLGWPMEITAMPFISQDGQYLRCAHAAMWMVLHHMHLSWGMPRRLPSDIHDATAGGVVVGRQLPSGGLSHEQLMGGLSSLGLSPGHLQLTSTRQAATALDEPELALYPVMCRHVNSNLPPLIRSSKHVWLAVAYVQEPSSGSQAVTLYCHDDALGPYLRVDDPWSADDVDPAATPNRRGMQDQPWSAAILPLPPKFYMNAERAEGVAARILGDHLASARADGADDVSRAEVDDALRYRTYGIRGRDYKHGLTRRPVIDAGLARFYRLLPLPAYVWVVELIDKRLVGTDGSGPCVLGEVVLDPTAMREPTLIDDGLIAVHMPGWARADGPEYGTKWQTDPAAGAYSSGRPARPYPQAPDNSAAQGAAQ